VLESLMHACGHPDRHLAARSAAVPTHTSEWIDPLLRARHRCGRGDLCGNYREHFRRLERTAGARPPRPRPEVRWIENTSDSECVDGGGPRRRLTTFALSNASKRARTRSIGSRSRGSLFIGSRSRGSTPLRDVAPALNGRASLARVQPCRTGAASFMVARARGRARRRA
jgi:hypothetical protein